MKWMGELRWSIYDLMNYMWDYQVYRNILNFSNLEWFRSWSELLMKTVGLVVIKTAMLIFNHDQDYWLITAVLRQPKTVYTEKKKESLVTEPSLLKESLIIPELSMHFIRRSSLIFWWESYNHRLYDDCTMIIQRSSIVRLYNDSYQEIGDDRLMKCIDYSIMISDSFRRLGFVTSDSFYFLCVASWIICWQCYLKLCESSTLSKSQ